MEVSDEQRVILAVFVLKGNALECLMVQKEAEFIRIAQGTQSVYEYERKFAELSRFAPHMVDTEARKGRHFERGLREEIQGLVSMFKWETYVEVVDRALIAERNCNHLSKANDQERKPNQSNFLKGKSSGSSFKKQGVPNSNKKAHKTCPRCGKAHSGTCYLESGACFKCGKTGHFIEDCPNLRAEQTTNTNGANKNPRFKVEFLL
ncbi:uncharacterized protein LOC126709967 [Quercus robur]|uniref:uncharacterized protein LOC126709967 n=1 Tax=Quercus robur TaxID=38942 RepID=UPI0021617154|nr:uncharacterized protein LOC126709967 [Quercus robur]